MTAVAVAAGAVLLLTACDSDEVRDVNGDHTNDGAAAGGSSLTDLLSRTEQMPVSRLRIEYVNQQRMRELAETGGRWEGYGDRVAGKASAYLEQERRSTGIDVVAADRLYYVGYAGVFGENIELVEGNQDTEAIATVAEVGGWFRDGDTFGAPTEGDTAFEVGRFEWMVLNDGSVLRGEEDSYMEGVRFADSDGASGGQSFGDDNAMTELAECVGDSVVVTILDTSVLGPNFRGTDKANGQIAVGLVAEDDGGARTVVCAHSDDAEALGDDALTDIDAGTRRDDPVQPWSDYISGATVDVNGDLLRIVLDMPDETPPDELVASLNLLAYGMPGFGG